MAHSIKLKPTAPPPVVLNQNFYGSKSSCTRHPNHQQSPGVCSVCVNEKLARLSNTNSSSLEPGSSISTSLSFSSYASSECSSPGAVRAKYGKRGSVSFVKRSQKEEAVLSKSRSVAAAFVKRVRGGGKLEMRSGGGFWSNVLKRTTKRKKMER
ncbi:hypothetical protein QQ045_013186 [Rhodiola kirilowii]